MFMRPQSGRPAADVIPYFEDGWYHLFYLSPVAPDGDRLRSAWEHVRSTDLVLWESMPTVLVPEAGAPDVDGAWTGSVARVGEQWIAYYTARDLSSDDGEQTLAIASSRDLVHFDKQPDPGLPYPDPLDWDVDNWRDPFVFRAGDGYHMLITARRPTEGHNRTGAVAVSDSVDGRRWSTPRLFYDASGTFCPECPDLRYLDATRVLSFSTFTDRRATVFRIHDGEGWRVPRNAEPDGGWWYAAKSLTNSEGRVFCFGWIPDLADPADDTSALWGGDLAVAREMWLAGNDELAWKIPPEVRGAFGEMAPLALVGAPSGDGDEIRVPALTRVRRMRLEHRFDAKASLTEFDIVARGGGRVSILIDVPESLDGGFELDIDYGRAIVELRRVGSTTPAKWPRESIVLHPLPPGEHVRLQLVRRGDLLEFCLDDRMWLTARSSIGTRSLGLAFDGVDAKVNVGAAEQIGVSVR